MQGRNGIINATINIAMSSPAISEIIELFTKMHIYKGLYYINLLRIQQSYLAVL